MTGQCPICCFSLILLYASPKPTGDGDDTGDKSVEFASEELHKREQASQSLIRASLADHTARCDLFIGGFSPLVVRAEAEIDHAHRKLLSEQHARSFVRETVPDVKSLESAMHRSKRLAKEREKAGVSDQEHFLRTHCRDAAAGASKGNKQEERGSESFEWGSIMEEEVHIAKAIPL